MASATLIPVEEYFRTTYRPDREYLEGALVERNVGERDHSALQMALAAYLFSRRKQWRIVVLPEQRVQVKPRRYRIPDITVLNASDPNEPIVHTAPLLCIEILSREDSMLDMQDRLDDYFGFGVPCVWIVNPRSHKAYICMPGQMIETADGILRAPGTDITVPLSELLEA
jgi:Uma2 family endonuclease